jgi:predicted dehydrogenase
MRVLIVGAGPIGREYSKICEDQKVDFALANRSVKDNVKIDFIVDVLSMDKLFFSGFTHVIIAVQPELSFDVGIHVLENSEALILIEKPFVLSSSQFKTIKKIEFDQRIFIALNRRWFESSLKLRDEIYLEELQEIEIEFSEHIGRMRGTVNEIERWAIANSIHVIDMALHNFGVPKVSFHHNLMNKGKGYIYSSAILGNTHIISKSFWGGAGNWSIQIRTKNQRYILDPIETLRIQESESFIKLKIDLENDTYKSGFYKMNLAFLNNERSLFPGYDYYMELLEYIETIMNYD